ncbi:MAG: hypothetical protein R6V19_04985, partial [Armatimonadota bacterium]
MRHGISRIGALSRNHDRDIVSGYSYVAYNGSAVSSNFINSANYSIDYNANEVDFTSGAYNDTAIISSYTYEGTTAG